MREEEMQDGERVWEGMFMVMNWINPLMVWNKTLHVKVHFQESAFKFSIKYNTQW